MPELPDVEKFKRYIDSTSLHQKIVGVKVSSSKVLTGVTGSALKKKLEGRRLESTRRHGKHLGVKLDNGEWLVLHFGMTGDLEYYKDGEVPKFTRIRFDFGKDYHLAYISPRQLGRNGYTKDFAEFVKSKKLGIDALDRKLTLKRFRELASGRRGMVKSFLMNQSVIAGIGNEYADEILFQAKLHPSAKLERLSDGRIKELYQTMRRVLKTASDRLGEPDRLPRSWLKHHREKGAHCPRCGKRLKTKTVAGRTSYMCTSCQTRT